MRTALYFPHTEIRSQNLLKTSLLLWDKLEFIVPSPNYVPYYENTTVARAIELIGVQRYPSESEKQEAHDLVEDLATRKLPDIFFIIARTLGTAATRFIRRNFWKIPGNSWKG